MLYPNPCYNRVCYKGTALYNVIYHIFDIIRAHAGISITLCSFLVVNVISTCDFHGALSLL